MKSSYTTTEAARILRLNYNTACSWLRAGILGPRLGPCPWPPPRGTGRTMAGGKALAQADLEALALVAQLADLGLDAARTRSAVARFRRASRMGWLVVPADGARPFVAPTYDMAKAAAADGAILVHVGSLVARVQARLARAAA